MSKFDIKKFDDKISFSIWRVQMRVILLQSGLKKVLDGKSKKSNSMTDDYQSSDPRLRERYSLERERFTREGEILGYTWQFWSLRRDPKVGGGVGRTREVAKNRTSILTKQYFGSSYVAMLWLKLCSNTLAQVMKQYFGSSYVAMLWLKLCINTLAQVMKQYFGSSYVAMLCLKLCSNTLAQVMKQHFGSSYEAILWLKLCSNALAQLM
ncbi:hypothetical protein Lal_00028408 [Lupinus albus]|nr:hypothetical protein Lal_00028408 [Lupinus albus]